MTASMTEIRQAVLLALEGAGGATDAALDAVMAVIGPALCATHDAAYSNGAREALLSLAGELEREADKANVHALLPGGTGAGSIYCHAARLARQRAGEAL